jgi:aryl-alcohol dehydrogenase-like predicted oxidoreductase
MTNAIPTSTLGRTGIKVTRLGFGAMELRDANPKWPLDEEEAELVLNTILDEGIDYIDTADCYGRSEQHIGKFISHRRDEFTLATKCGCIPGGREWTKENLMIGVERSLKRLRTDTIDVMQLHGANAQHVQEGELLEALEKMREQGKVRWIGASTSAPHVSTFIEWDSFDVFQIPYGAFSRDNEVPIAEASNAGMGTVIRGGVSQGEPGEGKGRQEVWQVWDDANLDELRDEGDNRTDFVLRYTLSHPGIDTIIVGTKNPDHIRQNVRTATRGPLPPDVYAEAKKRLAKATRVE